MSALDQARLDWVTKHLKLTHYIYELAADGDMIGKAYRCAIDKRGHLIERQINFARTHILSTRPNADLDETNTVINEEQPK